MPAASRSSSHAVQVRDVVGHEPQQLGDASGVLHRGGEHGAVRLVDLPRLQRGAGRDQLGAGGQHEHGRAAAHRQGRRADGRRHADLRRAQHRARRQHDRRRRRRPRRPGGPRCPPRERRNTRTRSWPPSVCSTCTIASAPAGSGAPVMIRWAVPGASGGDVRAPGRDVGGHRQRRPGRRPSPRRRPPPARRSRPSRSCRTGGRATPATSGSASTRPRARPSGTSSTGSGPSSSATTARCSSTDRVARAAGANGGVGTGPSCPSVRHRTLG